MSGAFGRWQTAGAAAPCSCWCCRWCCRTLDYMAPEVLRCPLKRNPGDNKSREDLHYATAVDAWAVGVLAFELLTGR